MYTTKIILGTIVGVVGMALVIYYGSWQIALGVFLMLYGNNLHQSRGEEKHETKMQMQQTN